ncbi:hypothetical protein A3C87_03530 [Candidatus Kaiserbacteria bacterium RIFCSPHIGHO2_02_FULL_49_34]|uniref:Cache domain-containing protein n=1 Tax=Candidatus Kaiserbacteria bacterium RIFCSPHIGHO2_02_FULL_49_34 TaxID=1798491 RepID=A0A1F6DIF5_9BACT|nr:MAG: hypothetical protein A3C87_03530 [Candidatus Kaiserbacteria bacterium RIFCSPHIGHO2_02_FULL_49_34]
MKIIRVLYVVFGVLVTAMLIVAALWYSIYQERLAVENAFTQGTKDLAPYIAQISKTAWFVTSKFRDEGHSTVYQAIRTTGTEQTEEVRRQYQRRIEEMLRAYPFIHEIIFTYAQSGRTFDDYLDAEGVYQSDIHTTKTQEFRTRELIASLLRGDEVSMERIEIHSHDSHQSTVIVPYTMAFRTDSGALAGSVTMHVELEEFFKGFEDTTLKNLFVVGNEGRYLWHADPAKRNEYAEGRDSSFFTDYPEAYPDILGGRGERRVRDGNRFIQVRPIHVAFEVIVDGEVKKINTQNVSPQHYVWFIGYEEQ